MCNNTEKDTVADVTKEIQIKELYKSLGYKYVLDDYSDNVSKAIIKSFLPICSRNNHYICTCGYGNQTKNKYCFICNREYSYKTLNFLDKSNTFNGLMHKNKELVTFSLLEENTVEVEFLKGRILFDFENHSFNFNELNKEKLLISYKDGELHFKRNDKKVDFLNLIPLSNMDKQKYDLLGYHLHKAVSLLKNKPSYYEEKLYNDDGHFVFLIIYYQYLVGLPQTFLDQLNNGEAFIISIEENNRYYYESSHTTGQFIENLRSYDLLKMKGHITLADALNLHENLVSFILNNKLLFNKVFMSFIKKLKKKDKDILNKNFEKNKDNNNLNLLIQSLNNTYLIYFLETLTLIDVDIDEYHDYSEHLINQEALTMNEVISCHSIYLNNQIKKHKNVLKIQEEIYPINLKLKSKQVSKTK